MPDKFSDLTTKICNAIVASDTREMVAMFGKLGTELDRLKGPAQVGSAGGSLVRTVLGGGPGSPPVAPGESPDTFTTAYGQDGILIGHVVSIRLLGGGSGTEAYLASAASLDRRADAVVIDTQFVAGVRRLVCTTGGIHTIRLATAANPSVDTRLFLSAVTAGTLTDNPSESSSRLFEQDCGSYISPAKNALGTIQYGKAVVSVSLSRPSSAPAAVSI